MKITTKIVVEVERPNGTKSRLARTTVYNAGDNPSFERNEVQRAVGFSTEQFIETHDLTGVTPL